MHEKSPLLVPLLVCLFITLCLGGVLLYLDREPSPVVSGTDTAAVSGAETTSDPNPSREPEFLLDLSAYESAMNPADATPYLVLINKSHPTSAIPSRLVAVRDAAKDITLDPVAEAALHAMFLEMNAEGITGVFVTSAYRSYDYQTRLFNGYIDAEMAADKSLSYPAAREKVLRYSAAPGTSEHQSGLCVDLMTTDMTDLDNSFENYPVFRWLSDNAWKFGFILRFPKGKEAVTGYDYEPWHYRFVGRANARTIHDGGLCLEEFLAKR